MKTVIIEKNENNKKLSHVITSRFPNVSKNTLYKLFRLKDIKVNGSRTKEDISVCENDVIEIYLDDNLLFGIPKNIDYYYEDDNILIAYKPKGIECHKENSNSSFEYAVKCDKENNNLKVCHRLDTNTEGLVIFSKNEAAHLCLLKAFKKSQIRKKYLTFVYGKTPKPKDILSGYIIKDKSTSYCKIVNKSISNASLVITEYNLIEYIEKINVSILEITLHTGKTHQIRAHMKHIKTPVIGDPKYSTNIINKKFGYKSQLLYAYSYSFNFDKDSTLSYLNDINISLDKNNIIEKFKKDQKLFK